MNPMYKVLVNFLLLAGIVLGGCTSAESKATSEAEASRPAAQATAELEQQKPVQVHTPDAFSKSWSEAAEGALLIDVRTPREFALGSLEGAANWNVQDAEFETHFAEIPKDQPVYVFCARGGRSGRAAKKLQYLGFTNIHDMSGGFNAWKAAGLPIRE